MKVLAPATVRHEIPLPLGPGRGDRLHRASRADALGGSVAERVTTTTSTRARSIAQHAARR